MVYFRELRHDPGDPDWPDRDRFVLSTGHYSIALYAALALVGVIPMDELDSFGLNGSRLPLSTFEELEGVEVTGGSLGHGAGQAMGMALGLRLDGRTAGDPRDVGRRAAGGLDLGGGDGRLQLPARQPGSR